MSGDIHIDLHGLLHIHCVAPPPPLARILRARLGYLVTDGPAERDVDLRMQAVRSLPGMSPDRRLPMQMYRDADSGRWCAGLQKAGAAQIQLCPGPPVVMSYIAGNTSAGRLWWVMLLIIRRLLIARDALLCHGAVLARNGEGLLIGGHRGQGKTTLTLRLLAEGWDYVAEDKFLLSRGTAYRFEQQVRLLPYHAGMLPEGLPLRADLEAMAKRRRVAGPLLERLYGMMPKFVAERVRDRFDRSTSATFDALGCEGSFLASTRVKRVALMRYEPEPPQCVEVGAGAEALAQLQGLAFNELHGLDYLFDYYQDRSSDDFAELVYRNLPGATYCFFNPRREDERECLYGELRC